MNLKQKLSEKADNLKRELTTIYYAYRNPETPGLPKVLLFITLGYALSPIDLIPDFIPVLGYLDDLIIIPGLIALSIKLIPTQIMDDSRKKALDEPVQLKHRWLFAVLIILFWMAIISGVAAAVLKERTI